MLRYTDKYPMTGATIFFLLLIGLFFALAFALKLLTKGQKIPQASYALSVAILVTTIITLVLAYTIFSAIPYLQKISGLAAIAIAFAPFHVFFKKFYRAAWKISLDAYLNQLIITVIAGIILNLFLQGTLYMSFYAQNNAMSPSILQNDFLLIDKVNRDFEHEDIVLLRNPKFPQQYLLERVIAVPADTVAMERDKLILNGKWKHERYTTGVFEPSSTSTYLQPDLYYVLNDNRSNDLDSRLFGPITNEQIIGRAFLLQRGAHVEFLKKIN